jgi:hypothetical protein
MKSSRPIGVALAAGLGILSCEKSPSSITQPTSKIPSMSDDPFGLSSIRQSDKPVESEFGCYLSSRRSDGPYRYKYERLTFGIPQKDLATDGSLTQYNLNVMDDKDGLMAAAYCIIPNTNKARRFLERVIGHKKEDHAGPTDGSTAADVQYLPAVIIIAEWTYWYVPGPWDYFMSGWDNTSHDTGGGDYQWNPDLVPPLSCYPNDPRICLVRPFARDSNIIKEALLNYVRPGMMISDSVVFRHCHEMKQQFDIAYANGIVYRGAYNTGIPGSADYHYAATDMSTMKLHFEPWLLDSAWISPNPGRWYAQIANTALHEAAHLMGYTHPQAPFYLDLIDPTHQRYGPQFYEDYFKDLNFQGNNFNQCISWNG